MMLRKFFGLLAVTSLAIAMPALADKSAGQHLDDSNVATRVKAALVEADADTAGAVNVEVYQGAVQLGGFVDSQAHKDHALKAAAKVEGTKRVIDGLVVMKGHRSMGQTLDDTTMQAQLKSKLADVAGVDKATQINTDVRGGHVLMTGFVHGDKTKTQAGEIARSIKGVKQVHNMIAVTH